MNIGNPADIQHKYIFKAAVYKKRSLVSFFISEGSCLTTYAVVHFLYHLDQLWLTLKNGATELVQTHTRRSSYMQKKKRNTGEIRRK